MNTQDKNRYIDECFLGCQRLYQYESALELWNCMIDYYDDGQWDLKYNDGSDITFGDVENFFDENFKEED